MEDNSLHAISKFQYMYVYMWHSTYREPRDQTMRQVVAYKRLKAMENY